MQTPSTEGLTHLGKVSQEPVQQVELIPFDSTDLTVTLHCTEFSSLCPVTRLPDTGQLEIVYLPNGKLIETKSLKLYLVGYRQRAEFNEVIVEQIAEDLFRQAAPTYLRIVGRFAARGGICVEAMATRGHEFDFSDGGSDRYGAVSSK